MYRLIITSIFFQFIIIVVGLSQNTWVKTFGGSKSDYGRQITKTLTNDYILTGISSSSDGTFSNYSLWGNGIVVVKIDSNGNTKWSKIIGGGSNGKSDQGEGVISTQDSGVIITGIFKSNNKEFENMNKGSYDIFTIKLNSSGDIVWKSCLGGSKNEGGNTLINTIDTGCVVVGYVESNDKDFKGMSKGLNDILILRYDIRGNVVWKKSYGGSGIDVVLSISNTLDSGFIFTGFSSSKDGDFNEMNRYSDTIYGIPDMIIFKVDKNGEIVWKKSYGGSKQECGYSIVSTNDSCYLISGVSESSDGDFTDLNKGNNDVILMKLDWDGNLVWKRNYGGTNNDNPLPNTLVNKNNMIFTTCVLSDSKDGDLSSTNPSKFILLNIDNMGNIISRKFYEGESGYNWEVRNIRESNDYGYIVIGDYESPDSFLGIGYGGSDIFVMKLDSNGNLNNTTSINEFSEPTTTLSVHPNPFSNTTTVSYKVETPSNISIELLNTLGQTIEVLRNDYSDSGTYQLPLNVSNLTSGMYSVRMRSGSSSMVVPVWVVR